MIRLTLLASILFVGTMAFPQAAGDRQLELATFGVDLESGSTVVFVPKADSTLCKPYVHEGEAVEGIFDCGVQEFHLFLDKREADPNDNSGPDHPAKPKADKAPIAIPNGHASFGMVHI